MNFIPRSDLGIVALCTIVGCTLLAWHNLAKKDATNKKLLWEGREAALTAFIFGWASFILLLLTPLTGGLAVTTHHFSLTSGFWIPLVLTGVLNIGIQYANVRSLATGEASLVMPISSSTPAILVLSSVVILGEYPTKLGWLGVWVMAVGSYVLQIQDVYEVLRTRQRGQSRVRLWFSAFMAPLRALGNSQGVRWAFVSAMLGSVSLNYDGLAARNGSIFFAAAGTFGIAAVGNLCLAWYWGQLRSIRLRSTLINALWLGLLIASAHTIFSWAFRFTLVPYIGALKRLAIPLVVVGAYFKFRNERKRFPGRFLGALIMVLGALLIAFGGIQHK